MKKPVAKKQAVKKPAVKKPVAKKPVIEYIVEITTTKGKIGYYIGNSEFDDDIKKAKSGIRVVAQEWADLIGYFAVGVESARILKK